MHANNEIGVLQDIKAIANFVVQIKQFSMWMQLKVLVKLKLIWKN